MCGSLPDCKPPRSFPSTIISGNAERRARLQTGRRVERLLAAISYRRPYYCCCWPDSQTLRRRTPKLANWIRA